MLGIPTPRKSKQQRMQKRARKQMRQGRHAIGQLVGRGRHRAEALRESLPAADDVIHDLRDQAQPMMDRAMEATGRKKQRRSRKPFLLVGFLVIVGVVAYIFFSRRDQEPAYLMTEPDRPDTEPATGPSTPAPSGERPSEPAPSTTNGSAHDWRPTSPSPSPSPAPSPAPAGTPSASLASAGTHGTLGHHPVTPPAPHAEATREPEVARGPEPASSDSRDAAVSASIDARPAAQPTSGPASAYEAWDAPSPASRAAWDLPRTATPPTRPR